MALNLIHPSKLKATALDGASGRINDGGGLALLPNYKGNAGQHRWVFRFTLAGKVAEMGLGVLAEVDLTAARKLADAARQKVGSGIDPRAERQTKKADNAQTAEDERRARLNLPVLNSVKDWVLRYVDKQRASWGSPLNTQREWIGIDAAAHKQGIFGGQMGKHVFPAIGDKKIETVPRMDITDLLLKICENAAADKAGKKGTSASGDCWP